MNKIILVGYIRNIKIVKDGVVYFTISQQKGYKDKEGKDVWRYIRCKAVESGLYNFITNYITEASLIGVGGVLDTYKNKDGFTEHIVLASEITLIKKKEIEIEQDNDPSLDLDNDSEINKKLGIDDNDDDPLPF